MSNITFDEFSQRFVNEININLDDKGCKFKRYSGV